MRVVVTGATGNIGTAVLRWLVDQAAVTSVTGLSRRPPPRSAGREYTGTDWQRVDLAHPEAADRLTDAFAGAGAVVHLAWSITADRDRRRQERTNRHGSAAVLKAARRAGVGHLTFLSSAAVYSPAPSGCRVREDWPRGGIPGSAYSADKVAVEDMLDRAQAQTPGLRIARVRPPSVLQPSAAQAITTMALGRLAPLARLTGGRVPLLPLPPRTRAQFVATQDVADLVGRIVLSGAPGAYNVADEPVLDAAELARLLGGRYVPVPAIMVQTLLDVTFRLRLQPLTASWLDVLVRSPVLDCTKAQLELGWRGSHDAAALLTRMRAAFARGKGSAAPPL